MFPEATPDMQSMLAQAAAMQEQLMAAQEQLASTRVQGSSGGGLVTATVNGTGELLALSIDPEACDPDDTETLADLVVAAVHDAASNAARAAAEQLGGIAGGLDDGRDDGGHELGGPAGFSGTPRP
jgi:DNA-binding YbaB/EbfC family protein